MFASFTGGLRAGAGALSRKAIEARGGGNALGFLVEEGAVQAGALMSREGGSSASQLTAHRAFAKCTRNATFADPGCASGVVANNVRATGAGVLREHRRRSAIPTSSSRPHQQQAVQTVALAAARRLMHAGTLSNLSGAPCVTQASSIAQQQRGMKTKALSKTKIKPYSSWKGRFQITAKGKFIRKQKGKRHKSFGKSPKQRMRLRATKLVHKSLVAPMKKLGFKLR
jgi:ribosomal protein L35